MRMRTRWTFGALPPYSRSVCEQAQSAASFCARPRPHKQQQEQTGPIVRLGPVRSAREPQTPQPGLR